MGKDVVEGIRSHDKTSRIPVFVISASVDDEDMRDMLAAGATRTYLKTKIVPSQLASEVRGFFAGK